MKFIYIKNCEVEIGIKCKNIIAVRDETFAVAKGKLVRDLSRSPRRYLCYALLN